MPSSQPPQSRPIGSTYRLQFHKGFTFRDAAAIVPYLHELGITHVYASPYLKARPGSTHGYDVIDHCTLNPEIGTREDYEAFVAELRRHDMGHILDIVPNHVGVATNDNVWWNDVLANGRASAYADYFDISWEGSPLPDLHGKVLLPVLGDPYGTVLEKKQLQVKQDEKGVAVWYYDRRFPLSPETAAEALRIGLERLNGIEGQPSSFDALDDLLNRQHYRLAWWRVAGQEINYRRFFDINDLAALRMELPQVFHATHDFVLGLVNDGHIDGLRIDHPDGLFDPRVYLQRLADNGANYVVVEKILGADEPLPSDWRTAGTTGYDFLAKINALFVDESNAQAFTDIYFQWIGNDLPYEEWVYRNKKKALAGPLASDWNMLALRVDRLAQRNRHTRDFTLEDLRTALGELIARFPVYRTYVSAAGHSEQDAQYLQQAFDAVTRSGPEIDPAIMQYLHRLLLEPANEAELTIAAKFQQLTAPVTAKGIEDTTFYIFNRLVSLNEVGGEPSRFGESPATVHQYLADRAKKYPLALSPLSTHDTKRSEDVRARISVLSEMPDDWAAALNRWDQLNQPLIADLQTGIDANERYLLYQTLLGAWPAGGFATEEDRADFTKRIQAYMQKAMREAKQRTTWTEPNGAHESAVEQLVADILNPQKRKAFLTDFQPFQDRIANIGAINSLSQTLIRLTAPGVPDTYQGSELIDLSLVDPDNRRPVDYPQRARLLSELRGASARPSDLLGNIHDGGLKLYLTHTLLVTRRAHAALFAAGTYEPLEFTGLHRDRLFGFIRRHRGEVAITIAPRLISTLLPAKGATSIPPAAWQDTSVKLPSGVQLHNPLTGQIISSDGAPIPVAKLLDLLPLAMLISQ